MARARRSLPSRLPRHATSGPVHADRASQPPETDRALVEPDLPRTAKARDGKKLREGFTTGACATAAAKAAALTLITGRTRDVTDIWMPIGRRQQFPVDSCEMLDDRTAEAVVVKDAGDDPDATNGARLTATVSRSSDTGVHLFGGTGVGHVTRPGLGLEIGGPAINGTPRQMIRIALEEICDPYIERGFNVVISVPEGERMAKRTTNARLGILGGISILGTTGIVRPFSTASWRASVLQAVDVMAARDMPNCVLTTGGRTERGAMRLLPGLDSGCFVEVGDFTGAAVEKCVENGLDRLMFVGMAGKLAKLGSGVMMTHYTRSRVNTEYLCEVTTRVGGSAELSDQVAAANTGRHAYELWRDYGLLAAAGDALCDDVAANLAGWARHHGRDIDTAAVMVDFDTLEPVSWSARAGRHVGDADGAGHRLRRTP
ncbi:cobalt-precorrin-5B (C(1))-methyltransferase [Haloglycomyces albus]|uniref:cobalt-precorrin-5B (C(1))-methyltransferase n=1 Tax=Haloglycomyces albus TaxID=526067 RepID=UPI00046D3307|nr:cobalt-precorrin-5B (C(1))-methyltransferase [Haloglycomyces albus]